MMISVAENSATALAKSQDPKVHFRGVEVIYPGEQGGEPVHALEGIDLAVREGEFVSLIGPSGCGKSTLLRVLADLTKPTAGEVSISGEAPRTARLKRKVGFVFQDAALLEWRRVLANVALPLEIQGISRGERQARARELIHLVGLTGFEQAFPRQLSGGMRQRAAIARAMSTNPEVMLMDEPFGALDQITRDRLNMELLELSQRLRMTVLFVTHSIREAVLLSDRVAVMTPRPGRITEMIDIDLPRPRTLETRETAAFERLAKSGVHLLEQGFGSL
jgi:NitT/TauT family transport system ATP-binding protein